MHVHTQIYIEKNNKSKCQQGLYLCHGIKCDFGTFQIVCSAPMLLQLFLKTKLFFSLSKESSFSPGLMKLSDYRLGD